MIHSRTNCSLMLALLGLMLSVALLGIPIAAWYANVRADDCEARGGTQTRCGCVDPGIFR